MIKTLEQSEIDDAVRSGAVVVDFWMDDCPPCSMMDPKLRAAAKKHKDVSVCRVRVEEGDAPLDRFGIDAMPAVLVFRDGEVVEHIEGFAHSTALDAAFETVSPGYAAGG